MYTVTPRLANHEFAIMRIIIGLLFAFHGSQKVLGVPPMPPIPGMDHLPPIALVAGWIELICGAMVTVGLLTGIAAFIASGEMAVAYFVGHFGPAMQKGGPWAWNPIVNKGEDAVLYCFIFLYIAAHGAGPWSIDAAIRGNKAVAVPTTS
jgi:putative oxidoreductase